MSPEQRIASALEIAHRSAQIDGAHHKAWTIDQMVRALLGDGAAYEAWIAAYECNPDDPSDPYAWDTGFAP